MVFLYRVDGFLTIIRQSDVQTGTFKYFFGHLLVDFIIFYQQKVSPLNIFPRLVFLFMFLCNPRGFGQHFAKCLHNGIKKHRRADRLQEKAVESELLCLLHDLLTTVSSDHNDGWNFTQILVLLNAFGGLDAIHTRHLPIHDHQLNWCTCIGAFKFADALWPRCGHSDIEGK